MNAATGKDPDFGRTRNGSADRRAAVLRHGVTPHFVNTQGGPRRNAKAQIMQVNGEVLPRLYSAGELGSIHSYLYIPAATSGVPGFRQDRGEKRGGGSSLEIEFRN